jgi:hypothetical protein
MCNPAELRSEIERSELRPTTLDVPVERTPLLPR